MGMKHIAQLILLAVVIAFGVYVFKAASRAVPHSSTQLSEVVDAS